MARIRLRSTSSAPAGSGPAGARTLYPRFRHQVKMMIDLFDRRGSARASRVRPGLHGLSAEVPLAAAPGLFLHEHVPIDRSGIGADDPGLLQPIEQLGGLEVTDLQRSLEE